VMEGEGTAFACRDDDVDVAGTRDGADAGTKAAGEEIDPGGEAVGGEGRGAVKDLGEWDGVGCGRSD